MLDTAPDRWWFRALLAGLVLALAMISTLLVEPYLETDLLTAFFLVAVLICSQLTGAIGGTVATVISAMLISFFFMPPVGSLAIADPAHVFRLLVFVLVSAIVIYSVFRQHRALAEVSRSRAESQLTAERLEVEARSRQDAEKKLSDDAAQLETILSGIGDAVLSTDAEGVVRYVNASACAVLRCEKEDCINRQLRDVVKVLDESSGKEVEPVLYTALRGEAEKRDEHSRVIVLPTGERIPVEVKAAPLYSSDGKLIGAVQIIRDVSERRAAEKALRDSEERFRVATDAAELGIWIWHPETDEAVWSPSLNQMLTGERKEYRGSAERFFSALHPDDREATRKAVERAVAEQSVFYQEFRVILPSRVQKWVIGHGRGVYESDSGKLSAFAGVNIDITDRHLAEEHILELNRNLEELAVKLGYANDDLKRQTLELQRINDEKGKFLSSMSHELRTPLNTICGFIELLLEEDAGPLNERQKRYLSNIDLSSRQLIRVVSDVLDLSRIAAGRLEVNLEALPVADVLDEVVSGFSLMAEEHGIALLLEEAPRELRVVADRGRLRQVLDNLVSNAIKFTPEEGSVRIIAREESTNAVVEVIDTGVGIAPEKLDRIFEEFEQVHTEGFRPKMRGSGLGLAITRKLVEMQGGSVAVESQPGEGSTFRVRLPGAETAAGGPPEIVAS